MRVIIVGGGKVGTYLATLLLSEGHHVRVIEVRGEARPRLVADLPEEVVVSGSGTDPNMLESVGVRQTDVIAAVTGSDEVNLVVTGLAKFEFSVPRVIARINNPRNAWLFTPQMGVDVALNQADLIGRLILEEMSLGDMMILLKLRQGQFSLVLEKVHPQALAVGRALNELELPRDCALVAVIRKGQLFIPRGDTVLQPVDEVLAVVPSSEQAALAAVLDPQGR
ncbi:MAG TPA: TrkA family potassium uptake protein [Chloroflexi bacterium]|jgi:trk system potassium uptake protein TrkA|nr:TrkA family potassium uptake protein [Chloroflexota bacterium]